MSTLATVRPGVTLQAEAAASLARVEARLGRLLDINRTIASWDVQMRLYLAWMAFLGGVGPRVARALHPSKSKHVLGLAIDSDDGYDRAVVALLAEHGWIRTASDEPWHFDYIASRDRFRGTGYPAGFMARPYEPIKSKEDDSMSIQIRNKKTNLIAQVGPDYFAHMPNGETALVVRNVSSASDELHELSNEDFFRVTDSFGIPREVIKEGSYWSRELANGQAIAALSAEVKRIGAK